MIWLLIELDIPQLSSSGIQFGENCFSYTYSLQSSSIHSLISSSFDATALDVYVMSRGFNTTFSMSRLLMENSTDLVIPSDNFNRITSFVLSNNTELKQIVIGDDCFGSVRVFELDGLSELESVVIGEKSFTLTKPGTLMKYITRTDGACRIVNCPKLKSIEIGGVSFHDYHSFELRNLPSLQSIDIGYRCFLTALSFSLTGLVD